MSAIYGYINLDGRPVEPEILQNMKQAMAFCGPDGSSEWLDGNCGMGQLLLFNTPESVNEKYPLIDASGNIIFMAACRIDNRAELFNLLDTPNELKHSITDGELMFQSYLKWGENACDKMLGDWSFVAFHKKESKLFLARDHCGITALYYYKGSDFLAFASSLKGLLKLKQIPKKLNEFRLAQILVVWPGDGEQTCYEDIINLKPGAYIIIQNKEVLQTQFWELKEQEDLILEKEEDYYERFREIFSESIRCRLRSTKNIGISLSGGLDSTSIAAVAAFELAKQNKELYAFTSVPLYSNYKISKNRNGDEGQMAGYLSKKYPNIRHVLVNADGYSPLRTIQKAMDIFDEPTHAAANHYWTQAITDLAIYYDVSNLLSGQIGNGVISWPTHKVQISHLHSFNFYKNYAFLLFNRIKDTFNGNRSSMPFLKYSDINPAFAKRLELMKKMKVLKHDPEFNEVLTFKQAQINFISQFVHNYYCIHYKKSLAYRINVLDPSGDKRLIDFSVSFPQKIYKKNIYKKVLITKGLKDNLPREIINSKFKGIQSADICERMISEVTNIKQIVSQFKEHSSASEILDFNKIKYHLSLIDDKVKSYQQINYSSFLRSISVIFFLKSLEN